MLFYLLAVPFQEERMIVKANVIGQSIAGDDTLTHNSTIPTPSETLLNVCSRPTTAPKMNIIIVTVMQYTLTYDHYL